MLEAAMHPLIVARVVGSMLLVAPTHPQNSAPYTVLVDKNAAGKLGDFGSGTRGLSANGRYVLFSTNAKNFARKDASGDEDAYVLDRWTGVQHRASQNSAGIKAKLSCFDARMSPDAHYVVYWTGSNNLDPRDTNSAVDVFVHDRINGTTELASVNSLGVVGNAASALPSVSGDGRWVCFASDSTNFEPGDSGLWTDIFVHDQISGITERIDRTPSGGWPSGHALGSAVSSDARFIAYTSKAPDIVPNDTNGAEDLFLYDRSTQVTERISVANDGTEANGETNYLFTMSSDARYFAFASTASNLTVGDTNGDFDVFVRDRYLQTTECVSVALDGLPSNGLSGAPFVSDDGRFIAFGSHGSNVIIGDDNQTADAFLRDRTAGQTVLITATPWGSVGHLGAFPSAISSDGRWVGFFGESRDYVAGDYNGKSDAFVRDWNPPPPAVYCTAKANSLGCTPALTFTGSPSASQSSGFTLQATNWINQQPCVFLYTRLGPSTTPFGGSLLCISRSFRRVGAVVSSGGSTGTVDCSGSLALDFNSYVASGVDPKLVLGTRVWVQGWSRDPGFEPEQNSSLTNALEWTLLP
jgi:Tol biopolymer transport system component